jgi:peptide/nickel transport system substrate-binding protein
MRRAAGVIALAALVAGCAPKAEVERIRIAFPAPPLSLDPHIASEWISVAVNSNIYESLVHLDPDLAVAPGLAVSWTNPDELTWVFELRRGVRFHDGGPFTAADAAASLMRAKTHPRSAWKGDLVAVDSVQAPSAGTLVVHTAEPASTLLRSLAGIAIVPRRLVEGREPSPLESQPVGTGPYRFVSREPASVRLLRWDGYYGARPVIRDVFLLSMASGERRLEALRSGSVDLISDLPEEAARSTADIPGCSVLQVRSLRVVYLGFDVARETTPYASPKRNPFRDRRVRLAVRDAIDAKQIGEILGAAGEPATQLAAPGVFGYEASGSTLVQDEQRAKALLREAGWAGGFDVVLDALQGVYPGDAKVAALVAESLERTGIRVKPRFEDKGANFARLTRRDTSFFVISWAALGGDVQEVLDYLLHTPDSVRGYGTDNCGGYSDPALDRMIEEAGRTTVPKLRTKRLRAAVEAAMGEAPLVPLYVPNNLYGIREPFRWTPRRDKIVRVEDIGVRP